MNFDKICGRIIQYSFYLLFFLVPLIMTPWNFELFEYNKMMLVYALTVIIVGAWITKMFINKKILLCRTPFDIPIILFLVSQVLSTVFSIDLHTSLFGYYSRFHGGLLSTISYILLYYALVANFDKRKTQYAIRFLLFSGLLVSIYGILEHFGIDAKFWVQDVKNRVFSTLGQPNWLAAWIAALLPIPIALAINSKSQTTNSVIPAFTLRVEGKAGIHKKNYLYGSPIWSGMTRKSGMTMFLILIFTFLTSLVCLIFTKSRSGIPAAGFSLLVFIFFLILPKIRRSGKRFLIPLIVLSFLSILITGFLGIKFLFKNPGQDLAYIFDLSNKVTIPMQKPGEGGSESGDIRKVVWRGAFKVFKANPLFGTGVETFAYSYYQFRPVEHNYVSEWDFLYNKAHNEYFNFLATTGIFGFGSYMLFIGWIFVWNINQFKIQNAKVKITIKNSKVENYALCTLRYALLSGWLSIPITNFFGFSVVPVALLFFLFPAFMFILSREDSSPAEQGRNDNRNLTIFQSIFSLLILCCMLYFLCCLSRMWYADTLYATGNRLEKQGSYPDAFKTMQEALKYNSGEPVYIDEYAYISSALSVMAFQEKQNDLSTQLTQTSLSNSDLALKISPRNLNFWRTRVRIYYNLAKIDPNYLNNVLATLETISKMSPTDAKIYYNKGIIYYQLGQKQKAVESLQKALELRPLYQEVINTLQLISK